MQRVFSVGGRCVHWTAWCTKPCFSSGSAAAMLRWTWGGVENVCSECCVSRAAVFTEALHAQSPASAVAAQRQRSRHVAASSPGGIIVLRFMFLGLHRAFSQSKKNCSRCSTAGGHARGRASVYAQIDLLTLNQTYQSDQLKRIQKTHLAQVADGDGAHRRVTKRDHNAVNNHRAQLPPLVPHVSLLRRRQRR